MIDTLQAVLSASVMGQVKRTFDALRAKQAPNEAPFSGARSMKIKLNGFICDRSIPEELLMSAHCRHLTTNPASAVAASTADIRGVAKFLQARA